jgi:ankyrin repeat protein
MERKFVMKRELPSQPNLEQLRIQAKELLKAHKSHEAEALRRIQESHPRFADASPSKIQNATLRLSDAQLVIAREFGFESWPKLKEHTERRSLEGVHEQFIKAFKEDNVVLFRKLLERYPTLKAKINDPIADFDSHIINCARSPEMLDAMIEAGADINAKSRWWAGGFGFLHTAKPELAKHAIQRGAVVDVHAAARLGMIDRLRELIAANSELVHARGGDGQTPLHFATTVEIAEYLLDHGADIDARDVDHESTPAQYMTGDRQEIARYLVQRGCHTDILMATALGDEQVVRAHLDRDPQCIQMRVSPEYFPMIGGKSGGTIYQWTLGWHVSAHQVAKKFEHEGIFQLLMERSPASLKVITACWLGDEAMVNAPGSTPVQFSEEDKRQVAHAARNNNLSALRLMLGVGLSVTGRSQHNATPLHWAAWHGNADMTRLILAHHPPLEDAANDFAGTPMRWAIHGSENGWHRQTGDYGATVEALIRAGAKLPQKAEGTEQVKEVLQRHGLRS